MRLPAITKHQIEHEDSRELNERLYGAFTLGQRVRVETDPCDCWRRRDALSANTRHFWNQRGFLLRTAIEKDKRAVWVWIEPGTPKKRPGGPRMRAAKTVGPVVPVVCVDCGWQGARQRAWDDFSLGACRECGGDLKVRPRVNDARADAKAKRELAEQEGAA